MLNDGTSVELVTCLVGTLCDQAQDYAPAVEHCHSRAGTPAKPADDTITPHARVCQQCRWMSHLVRAKYCCGCFLFELVLRGGLESGVR